MFEFNSKKPDIIILNFPGLFPKQKSKISGKVNIVYYFAIFQ